jgi:hypothetical protein
LTFVSYSHEIEIAHDPKIIFPPNLIGSLGNNACHDDNDIVIVTLDSLQHDSEDMAYFPVGNRVSQARLIFYFRIRSYINSTMIFEKEHS